MSGRKRLCGVAAYLNRTKVLSERDGIAAVKKAWEQSKSRLQGLPDIAHLVEGFKKLIPKDKAPKIQTQNVPMRDTLGFECDGLLDC